MDRTRFLVGAVALTLTLSLVAAEARAITLPDTTSPCSTGSTDGCLKIKNTDSTDYGAPAITAVSQSPFGSGLVATGNYYGVQANGAYAGVSASAADFGVYGSATSSGGYGVYGTSVSGGDGVYGQTSGAGKALLGYNTDQAGYAAYFQGNTFSTCSTTSSNGCLQVANTQTDPSYPTPAIDAVSESYGPAVYASGFTGLEAHGSEVGVAAYGAEAGVMGVAYDGGSAISGSNTSSYGHAGYFNGNVFSTCSSTSSNGCLQVTNTQTDPSYPTPAIDAVSESYGPAVYASGFTGLEAHGSEVGVAAYGAEAGVMGVAYDGGSAISGSNTSPSGYAGYFNGKVYSTVSFTTSDARLKKDVAALTYGVKDLAALRPVTFKWKDQSRGDGRNIGFLAQDLQKVVPELVDRDTKSGMLSVNYPGLVPVLVKSIQEQEAIIARQEARIEGLEQRPLVSSMFSGGINVLVAIGGFTALVLTVIRRRKERAERRGE